MIIKWLTRLIKGKPYIPVGEKHWLSASHYEQYRAFEVSLAAKYEYYRKVGVPGFKLKTNDLDPWVVIDNVKDFMLNHYTYKTDNKKDRRIDNWEVPDLVDGRVTNDCDGYAGFSMLLMLLSGFDRSNLRLALCWTNKDEYHMILLVRLPDGDYVLDNRYSIVWRWDKLPYKWHYMEDGHEGFVKIKG